MQSENISSLQHNARVPPTPSQVSRLWGRVDMLSLLVLAGITALALGLRAWQLERRSLWLDEILQARCVDAQWSTTLDCLRSYGDQGPLPYYAIYFLYKLTGSGALPMADWLVRLPSLIAGVLAIPFAWLFTRELLGRRAAGITALLLAITPLSINYSQQARQYAWLMLFLYASAAFVVMGLRRPSLWPWLGFGVSMALAFYSHYSALLVLAAEGLFVFLWLMATLVRVIRSSTADERKRGLWTIGVTVRNAIIGLAVAAALLIPWRNDLIYFIRDVMPHGLEGHPQAALNGTYVHDLSLWLLFGDIQHWVLFDVTGGSVARFLAVAALVCLGVAWMAVRARPALVLVVCFILPALAYPLRLGGMPATPRFMLFLAIPYYLILSAGLTAVLDAVAALQRRLTLPRLVNVAGVAALLCGILWFVQPHLVGYYSKPSDDWRSAAAYVREHAQPGDAIFTLGHYSQFAFVSLAYYRPWRVAGVPLVDLGQPPVYDTLANLRGRPGEAWGVVYNQGEVTRSQLEALGDPNYSVVEFTSLFVLAPRREARDRSAASGSVGLVGAYQSLNPTTAPAVVSFLTIAAVEHSNLLTDPGFSSPQGTGWGVAGEHSVSVENKVAVLTLKSDQITETVNAVQKVNLRPGHPYLLQFQCRNRLTAGQQRVYVTFRSPSGEWIAFPNGGGYACPDSPTWLPGSIAFRAPAENVAPPEATIWLRNAGIGQADFQSLTLIDLDQP